MTRFAAKYSNLEPSMLGSIRRDVQAWMESLGLGDSFIGSVILAVGELTTNAVRHGHDTAISIRGFRSMDGKIHLLFYAESHRRSYLFLRNHLKCIKRGRKHDFCKASGGGGLRIVSALSRKVTVGKKGNLRVTFLATKPVPRLSLGYCLPK